MNIEQLLDVLKIAGMTGHVSSTGSRQWIRVFIGVNDANDLRIGRASFRHGQLYNIKWYGKSCTDFELFPSDYYIYRFSYASKFSSFLTMNVYNAAIEEAKKLQQAELQKKIDWRKANPPGLTPSGKRVKRKRLTGKSLHCFLPQTLGLLE